MAVLHFGSNGTSVGELQRHLNGTNPTRLPRLKPDQGFGVLTMARVMEFQFRRGLAVDGAAGPATLGLLAHVTPDRSSPTPPVGHCILVDLIHNRLTAFRNGKADQVVSRVHGGSAADPSTRGVFQMTSRRLRHHTSSKFPIPDDNMQFSLFYHGAEAIHLGPPDEPSHGCIHVGNPDAERIFNWAGHHDIIVIVAKLTR